MSTTEDLKSIPRIFTAKAQRSWWKLGSLCQWGEEFLQQAEGTALEPVSEAQGNDQTNPKGNDNHPIKTAKTQAPPII